MDTEIRQRLIQAEASLLSALLDEELLPYFYSTWANLQSDITDFHDALTEGTLALAHSVASRISTTAQCYLDIQQEQRLLMDELTNGVEEILDGLDEVFASKTSNTAHLGGDGSVSAIPYCNMVLNDMVFTVFPLSSRQLIAGCSTMYTTHIPLLISKPLLRRTSVAHKSLSTPGSSVHAVALGGRLYVASNSAIAEQMLWMPLTVLWYGQIHRVRCLPAYSKNSLPSRLMLKDCIHRHSLGAHLQETSMRLSRT